jgi:hypothetical protein
MRRKALRLIIHLSCCWPSRQPELDFHPTRRWKMERRRIVSAKAASADAWIVRRISGLLRKRRPGRGLSWSLGSMGTTSDTWHLGTVFMPISDVQLFSAQAGSEYLGEVRHRVGSR